MSGETPLGKRPEQDASWSEKVLLLNWTFGRLGVPYAFGGAIALNYHREPRSTLDIDINVFLPPEQEAVVVDHLARIYEIENRDQLERELQDTGQTRSLWNGTFIDLFFANTDFHDAMAKRVENQPFADATIPVLSIEDLLVCKVLYDRAKDWVDIEAGRKDGAGEARCWLSPRLGPKVCR